MSIVKKVTALLETTHYHCQISNGRHEFSGDEPAGIGGGDKGPTPSEYLLAGIASCTAITMRIYTERKGWDLGNIHVEACIVEEEGKRFVDKTYHFEKMPDEAQLARILKIAEKCPVTRMVKDGMEMRTKVA